MFDERVLSVRDGKIATSGSWVYAWTRPTDGTVIYVGATGLPLDARAWLHLNDENPQVGRIRSDHSEALTGEAQVRGFQLPEALDRQAVKRAVIALLDGLPTPSGSDASTLDAARHVVSRLSD